MSGWGAAQWLQDADEETAAVAVFAPPPKVTKATQPTLHETLWRCTVCQKWSHAKRRPRHHKRFTWTVDADDVILGSEEGTDEQGGPAVFWYVACGPFEKWEAWKVEEP